MKPAGLPGYTPVITPFCEMLERTNKVKASQETKMDLDLLSKSGIR